MRKIRDETFEMSKLFLFENQMIGKGNKDEKYIFYKNIYTKSLNELKEFQRWDREKTNCSMFREFQDLIRK